MGGGASKEASYALVWDVKTAEQHYKEVESRTPANLNKGLTVSAMVSKKKGNGSQFFQIDQDEPAKPPKKLRKGQSMIAIGKTQNANINMVNNLKRGNSEMALARRNTDMSLMKLENKGAQPGSKGGKVMMSARLPWLVKEAKIQSATACDRIKYGNIIGRGLMGTVRVCELDVGKFVAVKTISKNYIKKHNDHRHINSERNILREMNSPFCIRLFGTFQDVNNIHLIMEFAPGGELFRRITRRQSFPANVAKFYTAEVFLALDHVQSLGYVFRDLKPENVMLDEYGHCKLIDFGFAMMPDDVTGLCTTNVGTPAYLSPEQLNGKFTQGYSKIVDWWALGVFLYELLTSETPFCKNFRESSFEIYTRVLKGKIKYPGKKFTSETKSLVGSLLHADFKQRLVNPRLIQKHPFFADLDWEAVKNRQVIPPFTPRLNVEAVTGADTVSQFDDWGPDTKPPPKGLSGSQYTSCVDPEFYDF